MKAMFCRSKLFLKHLFVWVLIFLLLCGLMPNGMLEVNAQENAEQQTTIDPPTGLKLKAKDDSSFILSWNPAKDAQYYQVFSKNVNDKDSEWIYQTYTTETQAEITQYGYGEKNTL